MAQINSEDYHDFVFKNGKLVGEFEQMYQKSKDVPWHQDKDAEKLDYRITLDIASFLAPYDEIMDVGCGLGYFLNVLRVFGTERCKLVGYDVASTATKKAKELFPKSYFYALDFTLEPEIFEVELNNKTRQDKTLTTIRGFFWYVFPKMNNVVKNISHMIYSGQHLLISQNFPPLQSKFIGKDVIPNPDKLLDYFSPYFTPIVTNWLEDKQSEGNDNWFTVLMVRK